MPVSNGGLFLCVPQGCAAYSLSQPKGDKILAVDLQRRLARAIDRGTGRMMQTLTDFSVLLESGAYEAVCNAATAELKQRRFELPAAKKPPPIPDANLSPDFVKAEMNRA